MRIAAVLLLGGMVGCTSGDDTDSNVTDSDDTSDTLSSADRLGVPEKYKFLWNTTQGCDTQDGPGTQIYWHSGDATSTVSGNRTTLTATETWYWFHGDNSAEDCKDVWQIRADFITTDYDLLGCSECEEAWYFERTLIEQGCPYLYHTLFGFDADRDEPPDPQAYEGYLLFDTHTTFNGSPNEDNKMLVVARYRTPRAWSLNNGYGIPGQSKRIVDDPARKGPPGQYEWVGSTCVGSGGGGGGA
jgi:hypothetical protein